MIETLVNPTPFKVNRLQQNAQYDVFLGVGLIEINLREGEQKVDPDWVRAAKFTRSMLRVAIAEDYADIARDGNLEEQAHASLLLQGIQLYNKHDVILSELVLSPEGQKRLSGIITSFRADEYQSQYIDNPNQRGYRPGDV